MCYNSLLKRLMSEILKDETLQQSDRSIACSDNAQSIRDAAKQARDEKKKEAIERSLQRQADPGYFDRISEQNKKPDKFGALSEGNICNVFDAEADIDMGTISDKQSASDADPFRTSYSNRGKNKIAVR